DRDVGTDVGRLGVRGDQPLAPPVAHRVDQPSPDADDEDAADGRKDGDEDGRGDGGRDADLVEGGDDPQAEDEDAGDVGEELAVGQPAQRIRDQFTDGRGDRGGDDHDDDRYHQAGDERDHTGQQLA